MRFWYLLHQRTAKAQMSLCIHAVSAEPLLLPIAIKVRKGAKMRNQYNQVPHLTQDTTWESDKPTIKNQGAQWLSGRVLDSRPKGRGFEPHRRHCVVSLSKNINPSLVLVQPRKTRPFITERLLMGRKESNQTNKTIKNHKREPRGQPFPSR